MRKSSAIFSFIFPALLLVGTLFGCDDSAEGNNTNNENNVNNVNNINNVNNSNNLNNTNNSDPLVVSIDAPAQGTVVLEGRTLSFGGTVTGGVPPYSIVWNFEDAAEESEELSTGELVMRHPGEKLVTLTVTDSLGEELTVETSITVEDIFGNMHPWYGNLHSHSALSDGEGSPVEVLTWARDVAGYDFYSMTDHSEQLNESEWQETQVETDAFNEDGVFVALRGFEWSHPWNGHMCIYTTSDYNSAYSAFWISYIYEWLDERNALAQFNHPGREDGVFDDFDYEASVGDNMFAVETGNKGTGNNDGEFLPYYLDALDNGWRVAPTSNQDNHSMSTNSHRTVYVAPELSRESLLQAMEDRRFYSSDDPNIAIAYRAGDNWFGDIVQTSAGEQEFMIKVQDDEPILKLELITAGGTVAAEHTPAQGSTYEVWFPKINITSNSWYFLKVTSEDVHDEDGPQQIAVTAPIWFVIL